MRKTCLQHAPWKFLLSLVLAAAPAFAEDISAIDSNSGIEWKHSYRQAADEADREGKPILVSVTATWCGPCRQLKQLTFRDSRVTDLVRSDFVALKIDADEHPELVSGFQVHSFPTLIVVSPDLTILKRMSGFQSADTLVSNLVSYTKPNRSTRSASSDNEIASALEPVNAVKYGFDGFCLVTLLEETRVRKGSAEFVAEFKGQTVCFQSEEHRQRFLQEPDKYWPVANGNCLVSSRDGSMRGQGDPRMAVTWRGRIWMFSDRDHQRRFIQAPFYYSGEM